MWEQLWGEIERKSLVMKKKRQRRGLKAEMQMWTVKCVEREVAMLHSLLQCPASQRDLTSGYLL
jgi:hypothetical protein